MARSLRKFKQSGSGWVFVAAVTFLLQACVSPTQPASEAEREMASWARAEQDVRRLKLEREKFSSRHSLVGKTVKAAADELRADGYRCAVSLLDTVRSVPGEFRIAPARKALLYCELQSTERGDFCVVRFVRLAANWPDISQPLSVLEQQMDEVVVTQTTFRCDTPVDVEIDRKKRQEGRQE